MGLSGTDALVFQCIPMGNCLSILQIFHNTKRHIERIKFVNQGIPVQYVISIHHTFIECWFYSDFHTVMLSGTHL